MPMIDVDDLTKCANCEGQTHDAETCIVCLTEGQRLDYCHSCRIVCERCYYPVCSQHAAGSVCVRCLAADAIASDDSED